MCLHLNKCFHELLTFYLSFFLSFFLPVFQGRCGPGSRPAALWRQLPGLTRGEDLIKNFSLFFFYRQFFFHCWNWFASAILCCDMERSQQTARFVKKTNLLNKKAKAEEHQKFVVCKKKKRFSSLFSSWWWWIWSVELWMSVGREEHTSWWSCDEMLYLHWFTLFVTDLSYSGVYLGIILAFHTRGRNQNDLDDHTVSFSCGSYDALMLPQQRLKIRNQASVWLSNSAS